MKRAVWAFAVLLFLSQACSVLATRPEQEYSDATVAIRAAKEVKAETMAPGIYRKALEAFEIGKREYRIKNYQEAQKALVRARQYAEQAEFTAMKSGATRQDPPPPSQAEPLPPSEEVPPIPPTESSPSPQT